MFTGLGLNTLYQLMWTLPQWNTLVASHMAKHNTSPVFAVSLLLAFGALFHVHRCTPGTLESSTVAGTVCGDTTRFSTHRHHYASFARLGVALLHALPASATYLQCKGADWATSCLYALSMPTTSKQLHLVQLA